MTSYFGEPEFAEKFSQSRQETAAVTAAQIIELAGISPGERVIDLCCGPGLVSQHLAQRVGPDGELIGADASAAMLKLARRNVAAANARFIEGDAYALPSLVTDPVDCVVATSAWQNFLTDKERIAGAVRRVLKPAGRFAFDIRLRERAGGDASGAPPMMRFRQRIVTLLREEHPDLALDETIGVGPFGARGLGWKPYAREDIDPDVALMEANGFRLAKRKEVASGPAAGGMLETAALAGRLLAIANGARTVSREPRYAAGSGRRRGARTTRRRSAAPGDDVRRNGSDGLACSKSRLGPCPVAYSMNTSWRLPELAGCILSPPRCQDFKARRRFA